MDRFDLKWPSTDATFYTDGWRCRIVWRQKGGIGGTIDNNTQCVRRVADSLDGAPYLLSALKARGHDRLATQIESQLETQPAQDPAASQPVTTTTTTTTTTQQHQAIDEPSEGQRVSSWLQRLSGTGQFEIAASRRAKEWLEIGESADEVLFIKPPALPGKLRGKLRGKKEWVLKRTWPVGKRKAEYIVAAEFQGICAFIVRSGAGIAVIERLLASCEGLEHEELSAAAGAWRAVMGGPVH
jgi:hypothetical protein